jgi:hypothetical protein
MSGDASSVSGLVMVLALLAVLILIVILRSIKKIGPTEVGLVIKRFGLRKLSGDNMIAFENEAGYQADLLMPGLRWKLWPVFSVLKHPWVQVPAGQIGVVIAQVGKPLPIGAKSAVYDRSFGNFSDLRFFVKNNGQKGVQRPVLSPGTSAPIHPIGFLVITKHQIYGTPIDPDLQRNALKSRLTCESFGLSPMKLDLARIEPKPVGKDGQLIDMVGIVTTFEGDPLGSGDIASRLGGFDDVVQKEADGNVKDADLIDLMLGSHNNRHNNYQDYQAFLDAGGRIGLQYDTLQYGAYTLNPFLVDVEMVPMLVVEQGMVAVIKAYVGLVTQDTSGAEFKFGSLVRPGHRGIWQEPLRTGKYAINPRCLEAERVPTAILTLNWADSVSGAHNLDKGLKQITAKSREGFVFDIELQVQIHVPDAKAPRVISMVGTMQNLVNEVLQSAVGNHFRDTLQSMPAIDFINTRKMVQERAFEFIKHKLEDYNVETRGVYIQDVALPKELVVVLTQREIANQEIETYKKQEESQRQRVQMEFTKGTANKQADLASSKVGVSIATNEADSIVQKARGEATYIRETGAAQGAQVESVGIAKAKAYQEQVQALGPVNTALVNISQSLADGKTRLVPDILVIGGGGSLEGLLGQLMRKLNLDSNQVPVPTPSPIKEYACEPNDVLPQVSNASDQSVDSSSKTKS